MRAFGLRTETDADTWRLVDQPPRMWYFTAITRRADAPAEALANARGMVCDAWSRLDLEPFGFERRDTEPWFFRPPGPLAPEDTPPELEIVRATTPEEVEEFEAVSVRGFATEDAKVEAGSAHPAKILDDARMTNWIGRVGGRPLAAAMSYETDEAIGVFGVTTTLSSSRRNSSACSRESWSGGMSRTSSSAVSLRTLVTLRSFAGLTSRSCDRAFSPTIIPS